MFSETQQQVRSMTNTNSSSSWLVWLTHQIVQLVLACTAPTKKQHEPETTLAGNLAAAFFIKNFFIKTHNVSCSKSQQEVAHGTLSIACDKHKKHKQVNFEPTSSPD
jgi:hypothetical protein